MHLTNSLKKIREQRGLTQEQVAETVGVSRQTIIAIEKGNYDPSLLLALRLAKVFNQMVEDIFTIKK